MKLDTYLGIAQKKVRCSICTYSDDFEDMVEFIEADGSSRWTHRECIADHSSENTEREANKLGI